MSSADAMKTAMPIFEGLPPTNAWRKSARRGDDEVVRLSIHCELDTRVYFDPGPGLRISGVLKDWTMGGMAIIEVDSEDRALVNSQTIMQVPVTR